MCAGKDAWVFVRGGVPAAMVSLLNSPDELGSRTKRERRGKTGGSRCLRGREHNRWELLLGINSFISQSTKSHITHFKNGHTSHLSDPMDSKICTYFLFCCAGFCF